MAEKRVVWSFFARDQFTGVTTRMAFSIRGLKKQLRHLGITAEMVGNKIKKIGRSMTKLSIVAGLAAGASLKAFGNMEQGVTNVLTLMDDDELAQYGDAVNKLATESLRKFGFSTEETTKALFNNISALGSNERSLQAFASAQKLAIGGVTSLDTAVKGIAAIMNAYSAEMLDSTEVANAFFAAQKKGTTDVGLLASSVGKVAPVARSAGIGYQELLATMAQLTQGGLSTEESATALKGAISNLLKPTAEARKILHAEGVAFGAAALAAQPFTETLAQINKLREKNEDLLIQAIPNIRGFTAVASLEAGALQKIAETMELMQSNQLDPAFTKQMGTFNRAMSILKGNFAAVGIAIGSHLAPGMLALANKLMILTDWFNELSPGMQKFLSWGLVIVAVLAPVLIAIGGLILAWGAITAAAAAIGSAFGLVFAIVTGLIVAWHAFNAIILENWEIIKGWAAVVGDALASFRDFLGFDGESVTNTMDEIRNRQIELIGTTDLNTKSQHSMEVSFNDPGGIVKEIATRSTGSGLEVKNNMDGELFG